MKNSPVLQHLVLIAFKDQCTASEIEAVKQAAAALNDIPGVEGLQFVENVSPEGLDKGYTHCLTLTFKNENVRDNVYLPHSLHQAFVAFFVPKTKAVLVFDHWK